MDLVQSPERKSAALPGIPLYKVSQNLYYVREANEFHSWKTVTIIFNGLFSVLLFGTIIVSIMILMFSDASQKSSIKRLVDSKVIVIKALLAQPFVNEDTRSGFSRSLQIFSISLFGAFIMWHFEGILISFLSVKSAKIPVHSLKDLQFGRDFKIYSLKGGMPYSEFLKWSKDEAAKWKEEAFKHSIDIYSYEYKDELATIEKIMKNKDPNSALMTGSGGFSKILEKSEWKAMFCKSYDIVFLAPRFNLIIEPKS